MRTLTAVVFLTAVMLCAGAIAEAQTPTLVLYNGKVATLDATSRIVSAVAIAGENIIAVGDDKSVRALAGSGTRSVDLAGRTVIPGLIDSHLHSIRAGVTHRSGVDWSSVKTIDEGLAKIAAAAKARPSEWVLVPGGWHMTQMKEQRAPTAAG